MAKALRDLLLVVAIYNLALALIVYAWLAIFVLWLDYDYITTASILFSLFVVGALVGNRMLIIDAVRERRPIYGVFVLIDVLLVTGFLTASFGVFSAFHKPFMSNHFDMTLAFWRAIGSPFLMLAKLLSVVAPPVGDFMMSCVTFVEQSSVLSGVLSALLAGTISSLKLWPRLGKASVAA